jgi:hypothetical protein
VWLLAEVFEGISFVETSVALRLGSYVPAASATEKSGF